MRICISRETPAQNRKETGMEELLDEMNEKALPSLADAEPIDLAHAIFDVLDAKKASSIKVLRVEDQTVIAHYFVICTGNSSTQVQSLGGEVEYQLGRRDMHPRHYEGRDGNSWIVVDYGTVILHIFNRELRSFYQLEKLYGDAEEIHFTGIDERFEEEDEQ